MTTCVFLAHPVSAEWSTRQFRQFFPAWNDWLKSLLANECAAVFNAYEASGEANPADTVDCLLSHFPQHLSRELSVSATALGLMPLVLSHLGPTTVEQGFLALRRPFLAFLLAAASPTVAPLRAASYTDAAKKILSVKTSTARKRESGSSLELNHATDRRAYLIAVIQYVALVLAALNIILLSYQLSVWTITCYVPKFMGLPALWIFFAIPLHFGSMGLLRLRIEYDRLSPWYDYYYNSSWGNWLRGMILEQFIPCGYQRELMIRWSPRKNHVDALTWVVYFSAIVHIIIGSISLAGLIFISVTDALGVVARAAASAIVCKLIFAYEMEGMKEKTFFIESDEEEEEFA